MSLLVLTKQSVIGFQALFAQLDEELFPLEGDLDNLGPAEGVDLHVGLEHHQAVGGHAQLNITPVRVLNTQTVRYKTWFISGYIAVQYLDIWNLLKKGQKHKLNFYIGKMQHQFRVTGGYTGKAKNCIESWVPTVLIHRPLSV
jgi:hypothetical protein